MEKLNRTECNLITIGQAPFNSKFKLKSITLCVNKRTAGGKRERETKDVNLTILDYQFQNSRSSNFSVFCLNEK